MEAVLSSLPMMTTASVPVWVSYALFLVFSFKRKPWFGQMCCTTSTSSAWNKRLKKSPMNFVLKFRSALPWLQSDRCQNQAEYLINAEINTQNMLFGMTTQCVYVCMPLFIILQMVAHSDVHPQICLILPFPFWVNYHFSLFTLTTSKMA